AHENIADLVDKGSFVEYGRMAVAARRNIRTLEQLIEESPADGLVMGLATINGDRFPEDKSRALVVAYDYGVHAGTQGRVGHIKQDRMFELAERLRLPVVLFAEGGGGAVDSDAADKAARFMQLCDAHDIPLLSLNDNPGNMVGPEAEKAALVRHCCRSYLIGANITVPLFMVCVRKSYGLGKLAMTGGGMRMGMFAVAWPTGEFGGMGLEGQVKLGRRKELEAIADPALRRAAYERMVAELYERGRAINEATYYRVDDVIDPAETRRWIVAGLRALPKMPPRTGKKRPCVDGW
ncbi:MAG: carboxyl transferase domain-containing protein, partial [Stellaceae bacterium]